MQLVKYASSIVITMQDGIVIEQREGRNVQLVKYASSIVITMQDGIVIEHCRTPQP